MDQWPRLHRPHQQQCQWHSCSILLYSARSSYPQNNQNCKPYSKWWLNCEESVGHWHNWWASGLTIAHILRSSTQIVRLLCALLNETAHKIVHPYFIRRPDIIPVPELHNRDPISVIVFKLQIGAGGRVLLSPAEEWSADREEEVRQVHADGQHDGSHELT